MMDKPIKITRSKIIINKQAFRVMCILLWSALIVFAGFIVR